MEILYLPLEWNYCTVATYNILAEDTGTEILPQPPLQRVVVPCR